MIDTHFALEVLKVYGAGAAAEGAVGAIALLLFLSNGTRSEQVWAARFLLAAPIWPATIAYGIYLGLRALIELAMDR